MFLARPTGFEPVTPAFGGQYSIQLSYGRCVVNDTAFYRDSAVAFQTTSYATKRRNGQSNE